MIQQDRFQKRISQSLWAQVRVREYRFWYRQAWERMVRQRLGVCVQIEGEVS